jgi:5-methylcytosine-specific restriction endonuclease McrA
MMPYKDKADRNYRHEYETYQGTDKQKKNRAKRNAARAKLAKVGKVHKGDGKDVDHIVPLSKGGGNLGGNLRVKSKSANRSFKRNSDHSVAKK